MAATVRAPHFWLLSEPDQLRPAGGWRFILRSSDGDQAIEACDADPEARGERLELLAVVRGLEALDQPSRVTLITPSQYVKQGLNYGLIEWRENNWTWERFGQMTPVKNRDLWQRLDRALKYHQIDCRTIRIDPPHVPVRTTEVPDPGPAPLPEAPKVSSRSRSAVRRRIRRAYLRVQRAMTEQVDGWRLRLEQAGLVSPA